MKKVKFPENLYIPIITKKCIICNHRNIQPKIKIFKKCILCNKKICSDCYINTLKICLDCNSIFKHQFDTDTDTDTDSDTDLYSTKFYE